MAIPPIDPVTRLLPPGRHPATMDEVHAAFVANAPHALWREDLFAALCTWLIAARREFGSGRAWIDGGFVTHKTAPPHDADVAYIYDDPAQVVRSLNSGVGYQLLTLQDVIFGEPAPGGSVMRLQPIGGLVDAFLINDADTWNKDQWHELWSMVRGQPGVVKGYVEVRVDV